MERRLLCLLLFSTPVISNATGESCNAFLNVGLYNTSISSSATDAQSLALSSFCSADYSNSSTSSSQSAQIEASYGLFSGGAGGTSNRQDIITKQSQVCTSGFNNSAYSNKASSYSKNIYQGALDAWNKCQQIANQGLVFSVQPSSTMQGITVLITVQSGFAATYYGVNQFGSGTSDCTTMANGEVQNPSTSKPFKFDGGGKVTVTCKRNMVKKGSDLSADAQDLVFVTSADSLTVPLAAIGSFSRTTADKIKNDIILGVKSELSGTIAAFNMKSCPSGWKPADGTNGTIDLRGEFIRGWDNGRGVDAGRSLGSSQSHQLQQHTHRVQEGLVQNYQFQPANTNLLTPSNGTGASVDNYPDTTGARNASVGSETRPRNLALLYCLKN